MIYDNRVTIQPVGYLTRVRQSSRKTDKLGGYLIPYQCAEYLDIGASGWIANDLDFVSDDDFTLDGVCLRCR